MNDAFDAFFDKVDGAKDGRTNGQLEMKELRAALSSSFFSREERQLATMLLDEYDLAKSLKDGGGRISHAELSEFVDLNKGRLVDRAQVFSDSQSDNENRRAFLANLMERINFNFSSDNDDNRYLTRNELRTAMNNGRDKHGAAFNPFERELIETLYLNWKRDIKNVSERKGEDNDGISVYDLYALAERQPAGFRDISNKINQTYHSVLPELVLDAEAAGGPAPLRPPVQSEVLNPVPVSELPPVPDNRIEAGPPKSRAEVEVNPYALRVPSHASVLIFRDALHIPGQIMDSIFHHHHRYHYHHHHHHYHRDHHHQHHRDHYRFQDHHRSQHWNPRHGNYYQQDRYDYHGAKPYFKSSGSDRYQFHGGRR